MKHSIRYRVPSTVHTFRAFCAVRVLSVRLEAGFPKTIITPARPLPLELATGETLELTTDRPAMALELELEELAPPTVDA